MPKKQDSAKKEAGDAGIQTDDFVVVSKEEIERLSTENLDERNEKLEKLRDRQTEDLTGSENKEDFREEEAEKEKHELEQSDVIDIKDTPRFKNMKFYEPSDLEKKIIKKQMNAKIDRTWKKPRCVGLDREYSGEKRDDSAKMARIKNRLYDYYEAVDNKGNENS